MGVYQNLIKKKIINENEDGSVSVNKQQLNDVINTKPAELPDMWSQITNMANTMNNQVNQSINERIKTTPSFMQKYVAPMQNMTLNQRYKYQNYDTQKKVKNVQNILNKSLWEQIEDFGNDTGKIIENTWLGTKHGVEDIGSYADYMINGERSQKEKELYRVLASKDLTDEQKRMYVAQNSQFGLLLNNPNKIAETINNALPFKVDTNMIESMKKQVRENLPVKFTDENLNTMSQYIQNNYNKNQVENIAKTDVQAETRQKENEKISQNIEQQTNPVTQKLAEIAPSMGQMVPGIALGAVNPALGGAYFVTSAGGSYLEDAKARGMDERESKLYATIMGTLEGISEQIITGQGLSRLKKEITGKAISKSILENRGFNILENAVQEAVMEPAQEAVATIVGGKDKTKWEDVGQRMIDSGLNGAIMGVITNGVEAGLGKTINAYNKIQSGKQLTENEIIEVLEENTKARGEEKVAEEIKQGAKPVYEQIATIENKPINTQEQQTNLPTQENISNQNVIENKPQNDLKGRSFEDILDEAMSNYEYEEVKSPLQNRDIKTIGKDTKTNAYQYDNPEVKPYFQEMAQMLGEDIGNIASEDNRTTNKGGGTSLSTNIDAVKQLKDMGYSYNQIIDGIMDIIDDNGKENNALSKKIEIILDDQLRNGYTNSYGKYISPNEEYINLISKDNSKVENNKLPTKENILPVQENTIENNRKDINQVKQEAFDYLKRNNINMTTEEFIEWASNKQLEQENITDDKQQELYNLIYDIQNMSNNLFSGKKSKTADKNKLSEAISMKENQETTENIKSDNVENSNKGSFSMEEDTSNNTAENEIQRKINRSMTMQEAKDMVQRAFVSGDIYDWYDGKYKNGDEWLAGEGIDDVAMWIDNDYQLQNKYINTNSDILNEEYMIEDVLEAYKNGTLTGSSDKLTQRLDTSKSTDYKDNRFYAPKEINTDKNLYNIANQRVTNANRNEVYKARADFIINAHNKGYIESLRLTQKEVNEKLRKWANYPKKAIDISMSINEGVARENRWTGIENSSIVNELSVSQEQLDSLVKEIKGTTNEWQRRYIANTMLAIDTHMDYSGLTYDFAPDVSKMSERALADYSSNTDTINVRRDGQNTIAHETGHFIDHLLGRKIGNGYNLGITSLCRSNAEWIRTSGRFTTEQRQFLNNFNNFLTSIENVSDTGSKYKMSSNEVFARFVARFTEWTRNVATGNRYGYEAKWYDDHFTQSQYVEFAKLLQEYSLLETTGQVSSKIDRTKGNKYDQRIEDIYSELFNNQKQILPIKETSNGASINLPTKGENINWNEVERPEGKFRKHYQSIIESSNTTAEAKKIAKEMMGLDTYTPQSNESLLQKADRRIGMSNPNSELETLLGRAINNDKVSDVDIAVGERLIEYYSKIGDREHLQDAIHATALAGTQAGRTVQAMALLNHMTPQGQLVWLQKSIDKMNDALQQKYKNRSNVPQFELTQEMTDKILNTDSKEEMYKALDEVYEELGQQVPKSISEKIDEWRYFSMLANVKTHARNIIGNTAMHITQRAKDKVAGVIEGAVAKFNPNMERTHTIVPASKEVKQFAKNDVKNMDVQTELGMNENKYNPQSRLQNSRRTFKSNIAEKTLGNLFNLNSKALEVEDNIGLRSMYVKALSEYLTANKIDVNNMTDAQLSKARQYAIKSAQEATFHQASSLATALNQMGKKNAITKFALDSAIPFKKTPINVAKAGVQYSPVGLIKSAVYDIGKLRKGQITVNQYIDNISRGLTGTGITYMGYVLAEAGILKASGGDDDKKEKYDEEQGKQTYSLEIGGKSYSLDWLSPVGIPLFIGAEINEQANETKKEKTSISNDDDNDLQKIIKSVSNIVSASSNAINPMSEMSMISGLTNILTSYNKENAVGNMIVNAGKSYVNQFVPTALGQLARTTDDYERSTKSTKTGTFEKAVDSTINQIKSKIPGLRETLPVKTDIWGKEIKQSENLPTRAFNNFVNPSIVKDVSTDKVDKELNKLYDETKESSILPSTIEKTFTINKQSYRMTNDEYSKYSKQYGETSYNLLNKLVSSSEYSKLTNQEKQKAIEKVYEYAKESNKIDYAKNNNIDIQDSTLYNTMKALKSTNGQSQYLNYLAKTTGMDKEVEKNEVLKNSNYDNATKSIIYENTTGKDDPVFNTVKSSIKIDQYLDYKIRTSNDEFKADKDENGKTISGSAKAKIFDYVENKITGYENQLVMLASKYKLSRDEQEAIVDYVNKTSNTNDEVIQKLEKMSNNFEIKNGKVYFK